MPLPWRYFRCYLALILVCVISAAGCGLMRASKQASHPADEFSCGEKIPPGQALR